MSNVTLRIATPDDAVAIHEVYEYYVNHTVATFSEVNKPVERHREVITELLEMYPFLIAETDGRFLGFANAEPVRSQTGYRYCVELTIYLHPSTSKHLGIGKLLYAELLDIITKQGFRIAYGVICATNEASIAMHRSFGFVEIARFCNSGYKHGQWLDTVWMQKTLNTFDAQPEKILPFSQYHKSLGSL